MLIGLEIPSDGLLQTRPDIASFAGLVLNKV